MPPLSFFEQSEQDETAPSARPRRVIAECQQIPVKLVQPHGPTKPVQIEHHQNGS